VGARSAFASVIEELVVYSQQWLGTLLVLIVSVLLPLALKQSHWVVGMERTVPVALLGALVGLWASRRRNRWWLWPVLAFTGLVLTVNFAAEVWPPVDGAPQRMGEAVRRISWWFRVVWLGGSNDDPLIPLVFAGYLQYAVACWLGWASSRLENGFLALAPAGFVLATNTFFGLGGTSHFLAFVPLSIVFLAHTRLRSLEEDYERDHVVHGHSLRVRVLAWAFSVAAATVIVALSMPYVAPQKVSASLWQHVEGHWRKAVRVVHWLFPGVRGHGEASTWLGDLASAAMPSSRLLAGEASPGQRVVMYVRTSDPPPLPEREQFLAEHYMSDTLQGPVRYWRGMTYDTYTGRGWTNGSLDIVRSEAGERFHDPEGPREEVTQHYEIVAARGELLYAVAEPVSFDVNTRVRWRSEGDLAFVNASTGRYSVISAAPEVTVAELRQAGDTYPQWIRLRYLELPDVPGRVVQLAREIVSAEDTQYDKLKAIERYLRENYLYDLEIAAPAEGKDVVDYFLFEGQRGYCDYYASAMVVMARAVGIPARLASGYATGTYDYGDGRYVVTEMDAHSWPEAYFPGYGWVAFEPTVIHSVIPRPVGQAERARSEPVEPQVAMGEQAPVSWLWFLALAAAVAAVTGVLAWLWQRRRVTEDPVLATYGSLERSAGWLGFTGHESLTPREYADSLANYLNRKIERENANGGTLSLAEQDIANIVRAYELRRYGRPGIWIDGHDVMRAWNRLRKRLQPVLLRQLPARFKDSIHEQVVLRVRRRLA